MDSMLHLLLEELEKGKNLASVTIVSQEGSTPRTAGSRMLVISREGKPEIVAGSVGGGLLEGMALDASMRVLTTGMPEILEFDLTGDMAAGADMICGGRLKVFVEVLPAASLSLFKQMARMQRVGKGFYLATRMDGKGRCLLEKDDKDACDSRQAMEGMAASLGGGRNCPARGSRVVCRTLAAAFPSRLVRRRPCCAGYL